MKGTNKIILYSFLLILSSVAIRAQDKSEIPLKYILDTLELRFDITFTYLDENIKDVFLTDPSRDYNLDQTIGYLNQYSGLIFQRIDEKHIAISKGQEALIDMCGYLTDSETAEAGFPRTFGNNRTIPSMRTMAGNSPPEST